MLTILITSPFFISEETTICNLLFDYGLDLLHLRKPGADRTVFENFIQKIRPCYRNRIVLHDFYELVAIYHLRGIHLKSTQRDKIGMYENFSHISISCHTVAEIKTLPATVTYCFLSPVFDSLSKPDYYSPFRELPEITEAKLPLPVIALGGITPDKIRLCQRAGFAGVAVLGYIWERPQEAVMRFRNLKTPTVFSIAGFDPSGGAGITADLKTFESCSVYGRGILSALTFQNEKEYLATKNFCLEEIIRQLELQFRYAIPSFIKIGLLPNQEILFSLTRYLTQKVPDIKIIWDPILRTSSGFTFHTSLSLPDHFLRQLFLITPNTEELHQLFGENLCISDLQKLCKKYQFHLLWKGGHNAEEISVDRLIGPDTLHCFPVERSIYQKHGTGCILSAAITAYLARGISLVEACRKAQVYVSRFMDSNDSLLGYHLPVPLKNIPLPSTLRLQYITDYKEGWTIGEQVEAVCQGGIRWIQLRMKKNSKAEILQTGRLIKEICQYYNALFIVNDQVEIARQLDADGVHLGLEDMNPEEARKILGPDKIIGATCNTMEDIRLRAIQKVDYIGLGPFRYTTTKQKLSPVLGVEGYQKILHTMSREGISIPVFAIGGIQDADFIPLLQTGIQGIALSGLIKNSPDIKQKVREIRKELESI
ncbi:hypothetical protein CE91St19_15570 [Odoribacter laneus]|jgi:thiamine-phosphate diphosphorylase|uniref:thiamine phosphate synthase n=1 Tax=Odoribacter laneus TaxID=626933 RepID=UPI001898E484|nr:thiamine phosphate synthase [Odoribacter laneus]GKI22155.1 hypothetical protein CE91St19_15570 [Odoribacter laneus]GKI24598.1 hypothetical protein CE91St20_07350 [Odoribacter laneus]